jgi:hypothetical protein
MIEMRDSTLLRGLVLALGLATLAACGGSQGGSDAGLEGGTPDSSRGDAPTDVTRIDLRTDGLPRVDPGPPGPEVRIVYIYPTDRPMRSDFARAVERAARHVQRWYRDELGTGKTFRLHDPVVEVLASSRSAAWFATNVAGGPAAHQWGYNARAEGFALTGGKYDDPDNVWVYYVDSDNACGQYGGTGGNRVTALPANDLRGLVGETGVPTCPSDPAWWYKLPRCRWVGGLGHELAHAFGLPHPPGCDEGLATCDTNDLLWLGYSTYPKTYLRPDERAFLNALAFFAVRDALPVFDCNAM